MARKKVEINLQIDVDTNKSWTELLKHEGLLVIDVYQSYAGPLKALHSRLRAINNSLNDDLLLFATAKADTIDALKDYRNSCEPCFLFYAAKQLVAVVRGANAPVIVRTIHEQLAYEHKVLKGEAERKPIVDTMIQHKETDQYDEQEDELEDEQEDDIDEQEEQGQDQNANLDHRQTPVDHILNIEKPITICIIKPDMIAKDKKKEIIDKIKERGYQIVQQKDVLFTEEMVGEFYKHKLNSSHYNELVKYMTSGVCCVLALTSDRDPIESWRNDLENSENSFRSQYATDKIINGLHGCNTHDEALRELSFFFSPKAKHLQDNKTKNVQKTLALIRPSAFAENKFQIIQRIKDSGFEIAMTKVVNFDQKQAEDFYSEQINEPFFDDLVKEMISGPMMVLCLIKEDSVQALRDLIGPKEKEKIKEAPGTLRNQFDVENSPVNSLHAPSSLEQAERELKLFFPVEQTVALIKPGLPSEQRLEIEKKIKESGFIIKSKKSEKLTEDIAKEIYKNSADKPYFGELVALMTSGETDIYMLSRENAIEGWREIIGPVDPAKAKEENPHSLRSVYGVDILNNGLHGPSSNEQATHEIKLFFGD